MNTKVSATVPVNSINEIISQLQERENLILQKISEIEALRKRIYIFLFFGLTIVFLFVFLNAYFIFKLQRNLFYFRNQRKKPLAKKPAEKTKTIKRESLIKELETKTTSLASCQIKNCFFYQKNKNCQLVKLGKKIIDFSQIFSLKNKILANQLLKLGEEMSQNCYFKNHLPEKENFLILKKKLKRVRYVLNKMKREKEITLQLKKEIEKLWDFSHQTTLAIVKFQNFLIK